MRIGDSALGLYADPVIDGGPNALLAAEVSLCRLNRGVPKPKLNLLQLASRGMAEARTCPPEVVRREPVTARFAGVLTNDVPDRLFRQSVTPGAPVLVFPAEQFSASSPVPAFPSILTPLRPGSRRNCANGSSLG